MKSHPYHKYAYAGTVARTIGGAIASRYAPTATGAALGAYSAEGGLKNKLTGAAIGAVGARYIAPTFTRAGKHIASKYIFKSNPKARINSMQSALGKAGVNPSASKEIARHRGLATHNLRNNNFKGYQQHQQQYRSAMRDNMTVGQRINFARNNPDTLKSSVGIGLGGAAVGAGVNSAFTGSTGKKLGINKNGFYLEKEANYGTAAKALFSAGRKYLASQGSKGLSYARTYAPNALARGSLADKGIRGTGKMLRNPMFHAMGAGNAYFTDGSYWDKAKAYAVGGAVNTAGWRMMSSAGKRMAGKAISNPAMLGNNLQKSMTSAGMNPTMAKLVGSQQTKALNALKSGNMQQYTKFTSSADKMLKQQMNNMSFGQRLKFNFKNNPMYFKNKGIGMAGFGVGAYGVSKLNTSANSMLGISNEQLARKKEQNQYDEMMKNTAGPMRNNTVMQGNNPYS